MRKERMRKLLRKELCDMKNMLETEYPSIPKRDPAVLKLNQIINRMDQNRASSVLLNEYSVLAQQLAKEMALREVEYAVYGDLSRQCHLHGIEAPDTFLLSVSEANKFARTLSSEQIETIGAVRHHQRDRSGWIIDADGIVGWADIPVLPGKHSETVHSRGTELLDPAVDSNPTLY